MQWIGKNKRKPMVLYNHAYTLAFEVPESKQEDGLDVTPEMLKRALRKRIENIDIEGSWEECVGTPFDTFEYDEPEKREAKIFQQHKGIGESSG
jgi:hypothetical protein